MIDSCRTKRAGLASLGSGRTRIEEARIDQACRGHAGRTVGAEAVGKVTEDDYRDVLVPAVTRALEAKDVRLLYVLGDDFDAYSVSAMWADAKLWAGHMQGWQKIAVVTSHLWVNDGVKAFSWLMPGEVRTYKPDEVEAAKAWLAERNTG